MNQANKVKLGAFLLLSATLMIGSFLLIGIHKIFMPRHHAMTVVNTSVEGLGVGSQVKYLGFPVGKITKMSMRESDGLIAIYFDLFSDAVETVAGLSWKKDGKSVGLAEFINHYHLMCFVNAAGLMGGSYLELAVNEVSVPALPQLKIQSSDDLIYIPALPSHIGNAIQNISRMLEELSKINITQMADKINYTLDSASDLLTKSRLSETLRSINAICLTLEKSSGKFENIVSDANIAKLNRTVNNADQAMEDLHRMLRSKEMAELVKNGNEFISEARSALRKADRKTDVFYDDARELRVRVEMGLVRMENLLKQLTQNLEAFSQDPSQLVRGRRPAEK